MRTSQGNKEEGHPEPVIPQQVAHMLQNRHFVHVNLNSINEHIQFTIERPTVSEQGESIAFVDTSITVLKSG